MQRVNEKAGLGGHREPAATTICQRKYRRSRQPSTLFSRKALRIPDRRPAEPPAAECQPHFSADGTALGLLVLRLISGDCRLTPIQASNAWALVRRWLGELVESKHATGAA